MIENASKIKIESKEFFFSTLPPELQGPPPRNLNLIAPLLTRSKKRIRDALLYTCMLVSVLGVAGIILPHFVHWHIKGLTADSTPWIVLGVGVCSLLFVAATGIVMRRAKHLFSQGTLAVAEVKSVVWSKQLSAVSTGYLTIHFVFERGEKQKAQGQALTIAEETSLQSGDQVAVLFVPGNDKYCGLYEHGLGLLVGTWRPL